MSAATSSRRLLALDEAAEYLGLNPRTIRRYIADGSIRGYRIGGQRLIRVDQAELDALLQPILAHKAAAL